MHNLYTRLNGATKNVRHENARKKTIKQLGLRKKIFIRSTALCVFHITEPFITIKTKCQLALHYSSNPSNAQAVKLFGLVLYNGSNG